MKIKIDLKATKVIYTLEKRDSAQIGQVIDLFGEYGFTLTEPYLKKLTHNLWELRGGRMRALFGITHDGAVVVNVFIKKTQKTPLNEIKVALRRLRAYEQKA